MKKIEEYLDNIPMWATKKNTLSDIRRYLEEMGNPDDSMKIIHVAGTNGKGSVCSYLTSVLLTVGYHVATFTSPHLIQVRERFLIDGQMTDEDDFKWAFTAVKELSDRMVERGYQPPTYFEFLFYMFMVIAKEKQPDFIVLETGLGGRLDVTNVVRRPVLTVITSISMDHMQYLGDTVEAIAAEKAGIIKTGVPVVYDASCAESSAVIRRRAEVLESPWYSVTGDDFELIRQDERGIHFRVKNFKKKLAKGSEERVTAARDIEEALYLTVSSQADYQMMNASVAVRSLQILAGADGDEGILGAGSMVISRDAVVLGIERSFWPGRMELVAEDVYLDGAHNAGGVAALNRTIRRMQKETGKAVTLMFGAVSDKDHHQMIQTICNGVEISRVIIAHMDSKRCADTSQLAEEFEEALTGVKRQEPSVETAESAESLTATEVESRRIPVQVYSTVKEAWKCFRETKGEDLAFCAGSLYLVGEVKGLLKEERHD